jgi:hypothetical protein
LTVNFLLLLTLAAGVEDRGRLAFHAPREGRFAFGGAIGERIERNVEGWLLPAPVANPGLVGMFRARDRKPAPEIVPWAGEFAGKYLISALQALRETDRPELRRRVEEVVADVLSTQAEDGYIGPFPRAERLLGHWDLWGHYHLIQALLLFADGVGDIRAAGAAERAGDLICRTYLDAGRRVFDAGSQEMNMAVIHALGMLYRRTGAERYLRMMREIEKDWERAGDYFRQGLAGVDFYRTPRPRWESLHDLQGLVELFRITGDERYRAAFVNLWKSIARRDRHNTGGFSSGEQAVGHPWSPAAIETCCTVAWMALSVDMLQLTGEPEAADELELSTWNGLLGAQHPSGRWWTYNTPMDGAREASAHSIVFQARAGTPELNCCSVNGPRGLGMLSEWAVLVDAEGPVLNWYGPLKAELKLADGSPLRIEQETLYPAGTGPVAIALHPQRRSAFQLRLRIPSWSEKTTVRVNGGPPLEAPPGRYLPIRREWADGDRVTLELDQQIRFWVGDREQSGRLSLFRGPILLAYDQRWNRFDEDGLPAIDASSLAAAQPKPVPLERGPLAPLVLLDLEAAGGLAIRLCDFASAGAAGTRYRSWLPSQNAPPPTVLLDRPRHGERLPPGKLLFAWGGKRRAAEGEERTLVIANAPDFERARVHRAESVGRLVVDPEAGAGGGTFYWKVAARNRSGSSESEARSFTVDPALPPLPAAVLGPPGEGPDGVLLSAPLRGDPAPSHGLLLDSGGIAPAEGRRGEPGAALSFDGERGRIRYAIPWFPMKDYAAAVHVAVRSFPAGRIAQVLSAWSRGVDDPLRITVEGGKVFARLEAGRSYSTEGVPLEAGRWVHLAAVKRGPRLTLYVDGTERAAAAVPEDVDSEAENVGLGGNPNFGGNEFLPASMADFRLYARALEPGEIRELAR